MSSGPPAARSCALAAVCVAAVLPALAASQVSYPKPDSEPVRRRNSHIGVGLGYAGTSSVVHEVFGEGTDALIYVNQRVYRILGLRFSFGAVYLGSTEPAAEMETYLKGLEYFQGSFTNFTMKFWYLTLGPSIQLHFGNHGLVASGAFVLYDVVLDLASLQARRLSVSNDRTGVNVDLTYAYWIGGSWGLNAQLQWHWIDTTNEADDLYYAFVRGDSDPQFISFLVGIQVGYK
jgi:opacity protein-like surface antigen